MPLSQRDSSERQKSAKPGKKSAGASKPGGKTHANSEGANARSDLAPNAIPALKNFVIGLIVCTLVIVGAVIVIINSDSLKNSFVSASQGVSSLVPKEKPKPVKLPVVLDPPPPPKDELYGDDPKERFQAKQDQADEKRPPARKQRMRIE